ncbi:unannotated protein [freshwater metagenome]|uniref:Unannotated protein n=1 Tax=freshwater metagenome TaxID=449393 RepID=A0A6J7CRG0_9ZZZZ
MEWGKTDSGQATVEFLLAVPLIVVLGWGVWEVSLAGRTAELAGVAARAGARAAALGKSPREGIAGALPTSVAKSASVVARDGRVTVSIPISAGGLRSILGTVEASAGFPAQR